jgi:hypothetical protein
VFAPLLLIFDDSTDQILIDSSSKYKIDGSGSLRQRLAVSSSTEVDDLQIQSRGKVLLRIREHHDSVIRLQKIGYEQSRIAPSDKRRPEVLIGVSEYGRSLDELIQYVSIAFFFS